MNKQRKYTAYSKASRLQALNLFRLIINQVWIACGLCCTSKLPKKYAVAWNCFPLWSNICPSPNQCGGVRVRREIEWALVWRRGHISVGLWFRSSIASITAYDIIVSMCVYHSFCIVSVIPPSLNQFTGYTDHCPASVRCFLSTILAGSKEVWMDSSDILLCLL